MTIRELWRERFGIDAPRKIVCVGLNYGDHAAEGGREAPLEPLLFAKLPTSLIGPGEPIVLPPEDDHVDSEAELAVVIGRVGRRIPREAALEHVAGYTVANDVSARTLQCNDGDFLFDVPTVIAHASAAFTLEPGDLILTGTPSGVGVYRDPPVAMQSGDLVEVEVERIGVLANPVVAER